jgi:hypothetical protein
VFSEVSTRVEESVLFRTVSSWRAGARAPPTSSWLSELVGMPESGCGDSDVPEVKVGAITVRDCPSVAGRGRPQRLTGLRFEVLANRWTTATADQHLHIRQLADGTRAPFDDV